MPAESNSIYTISSNAVFEAYDAEVIVINMLTGRYYTLDAVALSIWSLLESHQPLSAIITATQQNYQGDPSVIAEAVTSLVNELEAEDLIVPATDAVAPATPPAVADGQRPEFQAPVLNKFTDMQNLLLLDPIHEVDVQGWPHVKAE